MTENTLPRSWQPQPDEPPEWVDRFHIYPVLGPSRTLAAASRVWTNSDSKPSSSVSNQAKKVALQRTRPRLPEDNPQGVKGGQRVAPPFSPPRRPFPLAWQEKGSIPNDCPIALPFSAGVKSPSAWGKTIAAYPVNPQIPQILVQTITSATSKLAQKKLEKTRSNTLKHAQTRSNFHETLICSTDSP